MKPVYGILLILLILLIFLSDAGSCETVKAGKGETVVLQCSLRAADKIKRVEWMCNKKEVHLYRRGQDDLTHQDDSYKGRTSLFPNEMKKGNISLKITNVTERDVGNYICRVKVENSDDERQCNINLTLDENKGKMKHLNSDAKPTPDPKPTQDPKSPDLRNIAYIIIPIAAILLITLKCIRRKCKKVQTQTNDGNQGGQGDPEQMQAMLTIGGGEGAGGSLPEPQQQQEPAPQLGPKNSHGTTASQHVIGQKKRSNPRKRGRFRNSHSCQPLSTPAVSL